MFSWDAKFRRLGMTHPIGALLAGGTDQSGWRPLCPSPLMTRSFCSQLMAGSRLASFSSGADFCLISASVSL
ncbi:hypothetical protein PGT21_030444 [Puccinia graminis f. sp. tritici]|uniref:Uncharacterized protein n=1 Tax=Puccinia graminis f. sp. tritici TaxID=56615 RepID=A0A5B0R232_PUCGR|nr:hypothetical protein PGT21_030444 [Puccinia graminis f. sp. tritici]